MSEYLESDLMAGKRGLIVGVANDHSLAWGIAQALHRSGAELAFTYQEEGLKRRVEPLAKSVGSEILAECDVEDSASIDAVFDRIAQSWGRLDFLVHAVAFSDRTELRGRYVDTSRENFQRTLRISCYSFTELARRAAALMDEGGSMVTLTYLGAQRVMPSYNVMGVAKAALEASVRYMAADLGKTGIRINAISAGPMRTLAGAAVGDARYVYTYNRDHAPLQRNVMLPEVGNAGLYLLSDLSRGVTGEVLFVDGGFNVVGIPKPNNGDAAEGK
ncbi:MAG TPA: SDR family oxidoreductase [Alphaproteobacteria bacterium]|nr:SDR family oxidoreductase [Alphaproteobacteria bacterium]